MRRLILFMVMAIIAIGCTEEQRRPIKVACIGDSITFGSTIVNREKNAYPFQLSEILGDGYDVANFGVSGATLLSKGDKPYISTDQFGAMMKFKPDVAFIMLGTNDSKQHNRAYIDDFKDDYKALIDSVKSVSPDCRVVLIAPTRSHNYPDTIQITPDFITNTIVGKVKEVAYDCQLEVIDLHPMFYDYQEYIMPDKIHPSSLGAAQIAFRLYEHLMQNSSNYRFSADDGCEGFSYHGFKGYRFNYKGNESFVVEPKVTANGEPWIWRARFWGHEPQVDIALLERGFHLVYNDVADMFGAPQAVERWEKFYDYLQSKGLGKKCVIEGMSRGGLIAYNFAAKNPEKIAMVYADAPVLDIKSWPLAAHKGKEVGEKLLEAYGFSDYEEALNYTQNPIDRCKEIAKGGFKMLHVIGDADEVVPASENTLPFIEKLKSCGAEVELISKSGIGHHPHSLKNPWPIVKEALMATGGYLSPTSIPTPGAEYRSAAGWSEGSDWCSVSEEITEIAAKGGRDLLLLGNSITQGLGSDRERVTYKPGREQMDSIMNGKSWLSAGISGDRTQHLLYRIENGAYEKCNPKCVVITIGINNLGAGDSAEETAEGIIKCVEAARSKMKDAKIVVYGALPAQKYIGSTAKISKILETHPWDDNTVYIDPHLLFAPDRECVVKELYVDDLLHLSTKGYEVWSKEITSHIDL